jgi:hypothetical protein
MDSNALFASRGLWQCVKNDYVDLNSQPNNETSCRFNRPLSFMTTDTQQTKSKQGRGIIAKPHLKIADATNLPLVFTL